jgi:hypothetical protein
LSSLRESEDNGKRQAVIEIRALVATSRQDASIPHVCLIVLHVSRTIAWLQGYRTQSMFGEVLRQFGATPAKKALVRQTGKKISNMM